MRDVVVLEAFLYFVAVFFGEGKVWVFVGDADPGAGVGDDVGAELVFVSDFFFAVGTYFADASDVFHEAFVVVCGVAEEGVGDDAFVGGVQGFFTYGAVGRDGH